ncbi:MAG: hypothetical protein KA270_05540, partial [Saprospiraceae bacterium]|nr:hypothetical protein [Saprospiraceae bacterium]
WPSCIYRTAYFLSPVYPSGSQMSIFLCCTYFDGKESFLINVPKLTFGSSFWAQIKHEQLTAIIMVK